jgi:NAD(P)-dependent dehydrogenase (short-subunit alcohol dehydrogenase family)
MSANSSADSNNDGVILVTGASSRIMGEFVKQINDRQITAGISRPAAISLTRRPNSKTDCEFDFSDDKSIYRLDQHLREIDKSGKVIGLVLAHRCREHESSLMKIAAELEILQSLVKLCIKNRSCHSKVSMVLIGSTASRRYCPEQTPLYHMKKAAEEALLTSYAISSDEVRLNTIVPGFVVRNEEMNPSINLSTSDIIPVIQFLLSKESDAINGQRIAIDKGLSQISIFSALAGLFRVSSKSS